MKKLLLILLLCLPGMVQAQISGPAQTCLYQSYGYTDVNPGGTFTMTNTRATISADGSLMTVWSTGIDTVVYTYGGGADSFVVSIFKFTSPIIVQRPEMCWIQTNNMRDSTLGTWSTSNTAVASFINGKPHGLTATLRAVTSGTVTVIFTPDSNACNYAPVTANIQIDTFLSPITYLPDTNVCVGGVTVFSDHPAPGTWTVINPAIASVTSGGLVTGLAQGNTGVIYTLNNACSPEDAGPPVIRSDTQQVYVFQAAQPISGPAHVNINSSASYTDATPGGTWSLSVGSVNTINASTGVLSTGPAQVTDTIYYTVTNTCGTSVAFTPFFIVVGNGMDSCHWLGIATPVPCPDYRAWKTTRDDQIDITNNLLYQIWTKPGGGGSYEKVFDSSVYSALYDNNNGDYFLNEILSNVQAKPAGAGVPQSAFQSAASLPIYDYKGVFWDATNGYSAFIDQVTKRSAFIDPNNNSSVFTDPDNGNASWLYLIYGQMTDNNKNSAFLTQSGNSAFLDYVTDSSYLWEIEQHVRSIDSITALTVHPTLHVVAATRDTPVSIPNHSLIAYATNTAGVQQTVTNFTSGLLPLELALVSNQGTGLQFSIGLSTLAGTSGHSVTPAFTGYIFYLQ